MPYKDAEQRRASQAAYRERNREKIREWDKKYYTANREKRLESSRAWHTNNRAKRSEQFAEAARKRRQAKRVEILALLGSKCARCGFEDWRALQIDHINGNGHSHRTGKSPDTYYNEIRTSIEANEGKYQLLCANCNQIKKHECGENPGKCKSVV